MKYRKISHCYGSSGDWSSAWDILTHRHTHRHTHTHTHTHTDTDADSPGGGVTLSGISHTGTYHNYLESKVIYCKLVIFDPFPNLSSSSIILNVINLNSVVDMVQPCRVPLVTSVSTSSSIPNSILVLSFLYTCAIMLRILGSTL